MTVTASSVSFFLAGVPFFYYFQLSSSVYLHLPRRSVIKKGSKGRLSSWPTKPLSSGDPLLPLLCPCTVGLLPPLSLIIYVHPSVQPKTTTTTSTAAIAATTCHYSLREAILLVVPTILTALVAVRGLQPLAESIRVCESHVLRLAFEMFENAFLRSFHCIWLVHFFIFIFIFFFFSFFHFLLLAHICQRHHGWKAWLRFVRSLPSFCSSIPIFYPPSRVPSRLGLWSFHV